MKEAERWLKVIAGRPEYQKGAPALPPPLPKEHEQNKAKYAVGKSSLSLTPVVAELIAECVGRNIHLYVEDDKVSWRRLDPKHPIRMTADVLSRLEKNYHALHAYLAPRQARKQP